MKVDVPDELVERIRKASRAPATFIVSAIEHRLAIASSSPRRRGRPRYGFKIERGRVVPNVEEQKVVALIRRLHAGGKGMTLRAIVDELERRGIPPREGARWHPNSVRRILSYQNKPWK